MDYKAIFEAFLEKQILYGKTFVYEEFDYGHIVRTYLIEEENKICLTADSHSDKNKLWESIVNDLIFCGLIAVSEKRKNNSQ